MVWRLTTRVFDLIAIDRVSIVAFGARIFAKKAKASCAGLAISNNQEKHLGSNRGEGFTRLGNGQKRLTE